MRIWSMFSFHHESMHAIRGLKIYIFLKFLSFLQWKFILGPKSSGSGSTSGSTPGSGGSSTTPSPTKDPPSSTPTVPLPPVTLPPTSTIVLNPPPLSPPPGPPPLPSWLVQNSLTGTILWRSISFQAPNTVWLVGDTGAIRKATDGGAR